MRTDDLNGKRRSIPLEPRDAKTPNANGDPSERARKGQSSRAQMIAGEVEEKLLKEAAAVQSNDIEAAAEEFGARPPHDENDENDESGKSHEGNEGYVENDADMEVAAEPLQAGFVGGPTPGWPPPLTLKRSKREEAEAFFAFTQRLAMEMQQRREVLPGIENFEEVPSRDEQPRGDQASLPSEFEDGDIIDSVLDDDLDSVLDGDLDGAIKDAIDDAIDDDLAAEDELPSDE